MTTPAATPPVLLRYVEVTSRVLPQHFVTNCCVNATRITLDALSGLGFTVEPVSVAVEVYNQRWMDLVEEHGRMPATEEEIADWVATGAWALGVDTHAHADDSKRGRWPGHVVALVDSTWIVDAAAGQFSRPMRGIQIPQAILMGPVGPAFLSGAGSSLLADPSGGAVIRVCRRTDDQSFRVLPGFRRSRHNAKVRQKIVRELRRLGDA